MARVERVEEVFHALAPLAVVLGDDEVVDDGDGFDETAGECQGNDSADDGLGLTFATCVCYRDGKDAAYVVIGV